MDQRLKRRVQEAGYEISYDPPKDGNCFYSAAAFQLGLSYETVKNLVFDYLRSNQIDVSLNFPPLFCLMPFVVVMILGCTRLGSVIIVVHKRGY